MTSFLTEFPISLVMGEDDFVDLILEWVRGVKGSAAERCEELAGLASPLSNVSIDIARGERITFDRYVEGNRQAVGFRHERTEEGRTWSTEAVLVREQKSAILTVRVFCLQETYGARLLVPKKPYFIKRALELEFGGRDADLSVTDQPHYLRDGEAEFAARLLSGDGTVLLPVVYVSRESRDVLPVDVEKLAFDLGGVAHVVVEPSRRFSFLVRDAMNGRNPYNGVLALVMPGKGIVKRYFAPAYSEEVIKGEAPIASEIRVDLSRLSISRSAKFGWDWALLQSALAQQSRGALASQVNGADIDEFCAAFDREIATKDKEIERLNAEIVRLANVEVSRMSSETGLLNAELTRAIREIYPGEVSDRVRYAILRASLDEASGYSARDKAVFEKILSSSDFSGGAVTLSHALRSAGKDSKHAADKLSEVLQQAGFSRTQDGKHYKLTPAAGIDGVGVITLARTPGDHRSGPNEASTCANVLGLTLLRKPAP